MPDAFDVTDHVTVSPLPRGFPAASFTCTARGLKSAVGTLFACCASGVDWLSPLTTASVPEADPVVDGALV